MFSCRYQYYKPGEYEIPFFVSGISYMSSLQTMSSSSSSSPPCLSLCQVIRDQGGLTVAFSSEQYEFFLLALESKLFTKLNSAVSGNILEYRDLCDVGSTWFESSMQSCILTWTNDPLTPNGPVGCDHDKTLRKKYSVEAWRRPEIPAALSWTMHVAIACRISNLNLGPTHWAPKIQQTACTLS